MKPLFIIAILFALPGCAELNGIFGQPAAETKVAKPEPDRPAAAPVDVGIDWNWRVLGDAAARPVQVFSMRGQTFVHMRDRRPAVLLVGGEVVPFTASWPYLVIQGVPDQVDVVQDGYRALAERTTVQPKRKKEVVPVAHGQLNRVERIKIR